MSFNEFEKFCQRRSQAPPWDHPRHPRGFPPEQLGKSSDIAAHLPLLKFLASQCDTACEFGVRFCASTSALISGARRKVVGYDLHSNGDIVYLQSLGARNLLPCCFEFHQGNTLTAPPIEQTDLLLIDSLHTFDQVDGELTRHAHQVSRFLCFHDTSPFSQGNVSVDRPDELGIIPAIDKFLAENPQWKKVYEVDYCHGLTVLEKDA